MQIYIVALVKNQYKLYILIGFTFDLSIKKMFWQHFMKGLMNKTMAIDQQWEPQRGKGSGWDIGS